MIVILEGTNGVGKSTYARLLHIQLGVPIFRPFRRSTDIHWGFGSNLEETLKRFQIPTNNHVEDFYSADFLALFKASTILDRSLPSCFAYAAARGKPYPESEMEAMLDFWQELLDPAPDPKLYVWLRAPYETAKKRALKRGNGSRSMDPNEDEYRELERVYEEAYNRIKLTKCQIDTSSLFVEDVLETILEKLFCLPSMR